MFVAHVLPPIDDPISHVNNRLFELLNPPIEPLDPRPELLEAQRNRKEILKRQIRRAQSRISAAERKRRTRRLILMGSYLEHVTGDEPDKRDRLMKGLDVFLERDRDRELFDLAPNKENADGNPD